MVNTSVSSVDNTSQQLLSLPQKETGTALIIVIGLLAIVSVGLAIWSPSLVRVWDRNYLEEEEHHLRVIADGIISYLLQNKAFPPSLISLTPDYVPYAAVQIGTNARGFPRYYAIHPTLAGFQNAVGLNAGNLPNTRFLLLSDLNQDLAPTITTPAEFDTFWNMDDSTDPFLSIHRGNVGNLFYSLNIIPDGPGGSYVIHALPATDSGGLLLPAHTAYHFLGTQISLEEDDFYGALPEVEFALTANTTYWFDPLCLANKQWNPLDPPC